jgi:transposase InsO family protein
MAARTSDGGPLRILTIIDEYTRECLRIVVERQIASQEVVNESTDPFLLRGMTEYVRSDNGTEFTAMFVRDRLNRLGVKTLLIEVGSPW